jgi:hypothetical protein
MRDDRLPELIPTLLSYIEISVDIFERYGEDLKKNILRSEKPAARAFRI